MEAGVPAVSPARTADPLTERLPRAVALGPAPALADADEERDGGGDDDEEEDETDWDADLLAKFFRPAA